MRFISNGDYIFPFGVHFYWLKQIYMWSYQTGSANPDGIIRMPGRLLDLLVFALFGNIAVSFFYLASCFVIIFLAFFFYGKLFLKITSVPLVVIASLFFTINPIFLGNISKVGLLLAVAMLPLCFVAIQKAFETKRLRYFLLLAIALNISLIHPFTFTVNFLVAGSYLLYMAYNNRAFMYRNIHKIALLGLVVLLLNAYFILPLASIGTVNKDVLSSSVAATPTDYTSLIAIANTGDIFTGLSLSKGVLKDYEFYSGGYQLLYLLGIFSFYVILFGVYVRVEKRFGKTDRRYFAWSLAGFLVLLLLAAVNFLGVKNLIEFAVSLPGGWIFRSPLKWQLYIPFTIATMLAVVVTNVSKKSHRRALYSGLAVSFVLMNAYISVDIYHKLLTPRTVSHFGALQQTNLDHKNFLVVNSESCFSFASSHPRIMTELNQILTSKNTQVKQISLSDADTVNLSSYDYILGCQDTAATALRGYNFDLRKTFADDAFQLYVNKASKPYVYANQHIFALNQPQQVGDKYALVTKTLHDDFDFTDITAQQTPATAMVGLQDAYDTVTFGDIHGSSIMADLSLPSQTGAQKLYINSGSNLSHTMAGQQLLFSPVQQKTHQSAPPKAVNQLLDLPHESGLNINYDDPSYTFKNIFPNSSLEKGTWQKQVGDCYAYGGDKSIGMSLTKADRTDGAQALQLTAKSHVACTGPNDIPVRAGQHYLLSFDYKSLQGRYAGYYIGFDNLDGTSFSKRLDDTHGNWNTVTKVFTAPEGAENVRILVYAYPDGAGIDVGTARYDNFQLAAVPNIQDRFYVVSSPKQVLQKPKKVSFQMVNPTKNVIQIHGARTAFYLETKETYSPQWGLGVSGAGTAVPDQDHIKVNNFMNGWFVDPSKLCRSACQRNDDGSYDMTLVMEFAPQHWFYIGTAISAVTFMGTVGYFIYDSRHTTFHTGYILRRGSK